MTPEELAVDEDTLNATSAMFSWQPVDTSAEAMQGLFTGYEVSLITLK